MAAMDNQGKEVAIKKIRKSQISMWVHTEKNIIPLEVACLQQLSGVKGVPRLLNYFEKGKFYYIIMEKPEGVMDLQQMMEKNGSFTEEAAREIFHQLICILYSVRKAGIVHRDVKLENVLVNPNTLETYLVDFGLASPLSEMPLTNFQGTLLYAPPEWLKDNHYYGDEGEVWSLGVLLYEMVTGMRLFNTVSEIVLKKAIHINKVISKDLNRLFRQMLQKNPLSRISLEQIMVSRWIMASMK